MPPPGSGLTLCREMCIRDRNGSGLNDDLNGVERPVSFDVPCLDERAEVVHSLATVSYTHLAQNFDHAFQLIIPAKYGVQLAFPQQPPQ